MYDLAEYGISLLDRNLTNNRRQLGLRTHTSRFYKSDYNSGQESNPHSLKNATNFPVVESLEANCLEASLAHDLIPVEVLRSSKMKRSEWKRVTVYHGLTA